MVNRQCLNCGKGFKTYAAYIRKGGGKYCSRSCFSTHAQRSGGFNAGSLTMRHRGYILEWAPNHPSQVKGYVPQHRLVVERRIGRFLRPDELVHHKNHVKSDNSDSNLEIMSAAQHMAEHNGNWVLVDGRRYLYSHAAWVLGVAFSTVKRRRKKFGLTHQQAIDYYATYEKWTRGPKC